MKHLGVSQTQMSLAHSGSRMEIESAYNFMNISLMMDYAEWPLNDLLLCTEKVGERTFHQLYSHQLDTVTVVDEADVQILIKRGIMQVDELPE